jgi:sugar-specific transcriptional regulator TrmB
MDKDELIEMIKESLIELNEKDSDIFKCENPRLDRLVTNEREINRELHETALNHRFAIYLENNLKKRKISHYSVDIEYNRNFRKRKVVIIKGVSTSVRPDILIHKRQDKTKKYNLLAVETKKGKISGHDIDKIKALLLDPDYLFDYGLSVSYCYNPNIIKCRFYSKINVNHIIDEEIIVNRNK